MVPGSILKGLLEKPNRYNFPGSPQRVDAPCIQKHTGNSCSSSSNMAELTLTHNMWAIAVMAGLYNLKMLVGTNIKQEGLGVLLEGVRVG